MKKLVCGALLLTTLFTLSSCSSEKLAEKGSVEQNMNINPNSVVGYVGDVMPFYDDGMMNVFYLQDGRNTTLGFHPFALMTTTDYTTYHDYGVVIPFEDDITSNDLALGTGSVIKDKNGLYHCFYTGHNSMRGSMLPYFEKIQHATSTDKINWTKHPEHGFYGGQNDFRDPYVYLGEDAYYHMLITTRDNNCGVIKEYRSLDLINWTDMGIFFRNDSGTYNMECPTFIKYNDYYYLSYSEQGEHRVTHYRYKKNLSDEWIKPQIDYFDGEGFYAGRIEKTSDGLVCMAWCGTKTGEYDYGELDWGGSLVTHELYQDEDGLLYPRLKKEINDKLSTRVSYKSNGKDVDKLTFTKSEQKSKVFEALSDNVVKISYKLNVSELSGDCGLCFSAEIENVLSNLLISFDIANDEIKFYNKAEGFTSYNQAQIRVPFAFEKNKDINITVVIDGQILTLYANDKIALTTRMYYMPEAKFAFYSNKCNSEFKEIRFYE